MNFHQMKMDYQEFRHDFQTSWKKFITSDKVRYAIRQKNFMMERLNEDRYYGIQKRNENTMTGTFGPSHIVSNRPPTPFKSINRMIRKHNGKRIHRHAVINHYASKIPGGLHLVGMMSLHGLTNYDLSKEENGIHASQHYGRYYHLSQGELYNKIGANLDNPVNGTDYDSLRDFIKDTIQKPTRPALRMHLFNSDKTVGYMLDHVGEDMKNQDKEIRFGKKIPSPVKKGFGAIFTHDFEGQKRNMQYDINRNHAHGLIMSQLDLRHAKLKAHQAKKPQHDKNEPLRGKFRVIHRHRNPWQESTESETNRINQIRNMNVNHNLDVQDQQAKAWTDSAGHTKIGTSSDMRYDDVTSQANDLIHQGMAMLSNQSAQKQASQMASDVDTEASSDRDETSESASNSVQNSNSNKASNSVSSQSNVSASSQSSFESSNSVASSESISNSTVDSESISAQSSESQSASSSQSAKNDARHEKVHQSSQHFGKMVDRNAKLIARQTAMIHANAKILQKSQQQIQAISAQFNKTKQMMQSKPYKQAVQHIRTNNFDYEPMSNAANHVAQKLSNSNHVVKNDYTNKSVGQTYHPQMVHDTISQKFGNRAANLPQMRHPYAKASQAGLSHVTKAAPHVHNDGPEL